MLKMKKFRGGGVIHTQKSYSFSSFATWVISHDEVVVKACFRTVKILKSQILEIRVKRRLCPEFQIVYRLDNGLVNICSLSIFRQKTKDLIKETFICCGYSLLPETKWFPKGQANKDIEEYDLLKETA